MSFGSGIASLAAVIVAALALAQGGFYPTAVGIAGAVSLVAVVAAFASRATRSSWCAMPRSAWLLPLAFAAIAALCAASSFAHGWTPEGAGVVVCWLSLAVFAVFCQLVPAEEKARALEGLYWFIAATAAIGCLAVGGILPPEGVMAAGRLCILFEYSNATGLWFGVGALLMATSGSARLRAMAPLALFALFATKSVGALSVVFLAVAVALVLLFKNQQPAKAFALAVSWLGVLAAFAVLLAVPIAGVCCAVIVCVALLVVLPRVSGTQERWVGKGKRAKWSGVENCAGQELSPAPAFRRGAIVLAAAVVACTVVAAVAVLALEPARWVEAQGTFVERLVQIQDGFKLLSTNVLLGVGPEQWAQLYPTVQTVEYIAAVNHCSYMQMALDGGMLAPILYVAAMGTAVVVTMRRGQWPWALVVAALLIHSVFDFDLHFFALQFLAVLLLCEAPDSEASSSSHSQKPVRS